MKQTKELKDLIWEKILADEDFLQCVDESDLILFKQHFDTIPEILSNILDDVADPETVTKARIAYVESVYNSSFFEKYLNDMQVSKRRREEFVAAMNLLIKFAILKLKTKLKHIITLKILCQGRLDNELIVKESYKLDLDEKNRVLFCEGKLTIRNLLEIQPLFLLTDFPKSA